MSNRLYGSEKDPLPDCTAMTLARAIRQRTSPMERHPGVWYREGGWILWQGEERGARWCHGREEDVERVLWHHLDEMWYEQSTSNGVVRRKVNPTINLVNNAKAALRAVSVLDQGPPCLKGRRLPYTVVFRDVILDLEPVLEGKEPLTRARTPEVIEPCTLNVEYRPDAECPEWERATEAWSKGDPKWAHLLNRFMGYSMLPWRGMDRFLFLHGKVRGGKGTICRIQKAIMGSAVVSVRMSDLLGDFGLDGLQHARVLQVQEMEKFTGTRGSEFASILKDIVGRDPVTVNVKYQRQTRNQVLPVAPILVSNPMPVLPNDGQGVSSKMLALPFEASFAEHPDPFLEDRLRKELEGIAAKWIRGIVEVLRMVKEGRSPQEIWDEPGSSVEMKKKFHALNSPVDSFLAARFLKNADGWVATSVIREQFLAWSLKNGIRTEIPTTRIVEAIMQETTWPLERLRKSRAHGVRGLSLRKEFDNDE